MNKNMFVFFILLVGMCLGSSDFGPYSYVGVRNLKRNEDVPKVFTLRASIREETANYTSSSTSFVVPKLPIIFNSSYVEISFSFESVDVSETGSFDLLVAGLTYENETYRQYVCACANYSSGGLADCDCQTMYPEVGDVISVSISLDNGIYTVNASNANGQAVAVSISSEDVGPFGVLSTQYAGRSVDNCYNLSPDNTVLMNDIYLANEGEEVEITKNKWVLAYSTFHCSLRVVANEVAVRFSWNSADWMGDRESCSLGYDEIAESSWVQDGQIYTYYTIVFYNIDYTTGSNISSVSFALNHQPRQLWGLTANNDSSYSLPSYASPLAAGASHSFGYISNKRVVLTQLECEGGERVAAGEQPGFEAANENASPIVDETGCSVNFLMSPVYSWSDDGRNFTQMNVTILNDGTRAITTLSFTPSVPTVFASIWEVDALEDGIYGLPSHISSIAAGEFHNFGFIASSIVDFNIAELICS